MMAAQTPADERAAPSGVDGYSDVPDSMASYAGGDGDPDLRGYAPPPFIDVAASTLVDKTPVRADDDDEEEDRAWAPFAESSASRNFGRDGGGGGLKSDGEQWNEQFQQLLALPTSTPEERTARSAALEQLMSRFVEACTAIVKAIVAEEGVAAAQRRYPPIAGAGVAGGDKFCAAGVFVKYASVDPHGIYGGVEAAAKSVNHEIRALQALVDINAPGLSLPLSCGIDWLGRRLFCQALLPVSSADTLVYGSADGGTTVRNASPAFQRLARAVAQQLNLAAHLVGRTASPCRLHLSGDVEGHAGRDGRFYLLDVARLFPPEPPTARAPRAIMSRFLRREFVVAHHSPLNPDAFSGFHARSDPDYHAHRRALVDAHRLLLARLVDVRLQLAGGHFDNDVLGPEHVAPVLLHRRGVNLRYLPDLLASDDSHQHSVDDKAELVAVDYALIELCARCLKCHCRSVMRALPPSCQSAMLAHVRQLLDQLAADAESTSRRACAARYGHDAAAKLPWRRLARANAGAAVARRLLDLVGVDETDSVLSFRAVTMRVSVAAKVDTVESLASEVQLREATFGRYHHVVGLAKLRLAVQLAQQPERAAAATDVFRQCLAIFEISAVAAGDAAAALVVSSRDGVERLCQALQAYGRHMYHLHDEEPCLGALRRCVLLRQLLCARFPDDDAAAAALARELELLGWFCHSFGRLADAELALAQAIAQQQRVGGSALTGLSHVELARLYLSVGRRPQQIEALQRQALQLSVALYGDCHSQVAVVYNNRGIFNLWQQRTEQAAADAARAYHIRLVTLGPAHCYCYHSLLLLAQVHMYSGRLDDADTLSAQALDGYRPHARRLAATALVVRARLQLYQRRHSAALQLLDDLLCEPVVAAHATLRAVALNERAAVLVSSCQLSHAASELDAARTDAAASAALLAESANPHHFDTAVRLTHVASALDVGALTEEKAASFVNATRKILVSELVLWMDDHHVTFNKLT